MHSFKDNAGRTWDLAITVGTVKRIQGRLDVDLTALADGEPPLIRRLMGELILQIDAIWVAIEPQAKAAGVSDEQWVESMGGEAMAAALDAFWADLRDFFRPSRPGLAGLAQNAAELVNARQALAAELADLCVPKLAAPGTPSTGSPASPDATPTAAPSASSSRWPKAGRASSGRKRRPS